MSVFLCPNPQISLPIWQAFLIQKFMKDEVIKNENKTVHGNGGNKGNPQILRSCELCQRSRRIYLQGCGKHRYFAYEFVGGQRSYHTSCAYGKDEKDTAKCQMFRVGVPCDDGEPTLGGIITPEDLFAMIAESEKNNGDDENDRRESDKTVPENTETDNG